MEPGGVMVDSGIRGILREELQKLLVPIARDIDVMKSDLSATSEEVRTLSRKLDSVTSLMERVPSTSTVSRQDSA
jgi:hypothetical protein